jgi:urease accessory protein
MKRVAVDAIEKGLSCEPASSEAWVARLSLAFADDSGTTRLIDRCHAGPLRVQKPLYPEGKEVCHAVIIHPPGGVVGGDQLTIRAAAGSNAKALITTPGAAKWYRANGRISQQNVHLDIGENASLEWLPQETIFFNESHVRLHQTVSLAEGAAYIGFEILCFGRTASGESFTGGRIEQSNCIRVDGKPIWFEQGALQGGSTSMISPFGLAGNTVCATLIAVGKAVPAAVIGALRQDVGTTDGTDRVGVTQMTTLVVVRYLGNSSQTARQLMTRAWQRLRPELLDREASIPRIWHT